MFFNREPKFFSLSRDCVAICLLAIGIGAMNGPANAQNKDESSRRQANLIQAIEAAGGKVYKISAAGDEREVSFYLSSKPIKDEHLKDINAVQNVIWLNLAGTEITNDGLKNLNKMGLQKLHLERTSIGDDGLKNLQSLVDLEYLNLYGTKVTDAGLEHLKGLKKLKKVYVWQTGVTEKGMQGLMKAMPGLEVVGEVKMVEVAEPKEEMKEEMKEETKEPAKEKTNPKSEQKKKGKEKKGGDKKAG